ncbi:carbon-phosphorus lyase complex subunit PhnI [Deinococcus koreensis]|uniref:Phosphonate metabolism protein PhnI n=1 Tax=Deinococcus koreensis TaxID=2054903 RepID=A0A2K3UY29_9DEIO|nr:carbon-phosphorus lyase complex subunit PhnI [Deinococcus koreensis]PNY81438.1 phosphonate metabolism protein PhnI [Deinococcus koreensis]
MAYVAARGGEAAILDAERLFHDLCGPLSPERVRAVQGALPYLLDRVMGEASLYAPELAALALAQTGGELYEAALLLRAHRTTLPRLAYAQLTEQAELLTVRRISAAFKDIPGGQVLGPTLDYSHRVLELGVLQRGETREVQARTAAQPAPPTYPALADWQRRAGLLPPVSAPDTPAELVPDLTREPLLFPAPRAHLLQGLARSDTGGTLALGYSIMRGYGLIHPTVNEVRLGYAEVRLSHPATGVGFSAGRVRVSQAEIVTEFGGDDARPELALGFCATLGWNEVKTIAGATLDMNMTREAQSGRAPHPAHSAEFVLYHTEGVEASGFCIHFKLPHYVTFQSALEAMRQVRNDPAGVGQAGAAEVAL